MQLDRPITIAVMLFAILLLVFFLVMPEYNNFLSLQNQLGEKTAEYNAEFDYYAAITKTYFDLQSRQTDISKIDDALPTNPDMGKTIYYLQSAAQENGIIIKSLFLSKTSPTKSTADNQTVGNMSFSISALGNYVSLERFLIALEQSSRVFEVTSIAFGSSGTTTQSASAQSQTSTQTQSQLQTGPTSQPQFQAGQMYQFSVQIKTYTY